MEFEKIHDLEILMEKCKEFIPELENLRKELIELSSFAVEIRYPGVRAQKEEAINSFFTMQKVRRIIKRYLRNI